MNFRAFVSIAALAFSALNTAPSFAAQSIAHDQIVRVTTGSTVLHDRYRPRLFISNGCEPYSAVDDQGNYSGGLRNSGSHNGNCGSSNTGISYSRSSCKAGWCGYMYAFYFPKDNGFPFAGFGHRHDWEEVVVWVKNNRIQGVSYSAHGDYQRDQSFVAAGNTVNIEYGIDGFTHAMSKISGNRVGDGDIWPTASWSLLTSEAKATLSNRSDDVFGRTNVAVRDVETGNTSDDDFFDKLNEARLPSMVSAGVVF